ncbi:unnamed protein product [Penicillium bialowiezense]
MYGKNPYSDYGDRDQYRVAEHNLCTSGNRFRDQEKGGSLESFFMVLPMPKLSEGEEWLLIDRTAHIRAIYIPVAQQASEEYPELCTFLNVNFAIDREVRILSYHCKWAQEFGYDVSDGVWETVKTEVALGLRPHVQWTLAINVPQLVNLLSVPRFLRKHNVFSSQTIRMVDAACVSAKGHVQTFSDGADLSWTAIVNANFGLTVQWAPPDPSAWLVDFIKNSVTIAAGFIPIIGPIAAVAFPLAFTAITDPASFEATLRSTIPQVDLAKHIEHQLQKSTQDQRSFLSDSWRKSIDAGGGILLPPAKVPGTSEPTTSRSVPAPPAIKPETAKQPTPVPKVKQPPKPKQEYNPPLPKPKKNFSMEEFKMLFGKKEVVRQFVKDAPTTERISQVDESDIPPAPPQRITILDDGSSRVDSMATDPPAEQEDLNLEILESPPFGDLVISAQFQLADQILRHWGEGSAFTSNTEESTDDPPGEVIGEQFPENSLLSDETIPENNYSWMDNYLYEIWFGSEEQTDETEIEADLEQGEEMEQGEGAEQETEM